MLVVPSRCIVTGYVILCIVRVTHMVVMMRAAGRWGGTTVKVVAIGHWLGPGPVVVVVGYWPIGRVGWIITSPQPVSGIPIRWVLWIGRL